MLYATEAPHFDCRSHKASIACGFGVSFTDCRNVHAVVQ